MRAEGNNTAHEMESKTAAPKIAKNERAENEGAIATSPVQRRTKAKSRLSFLLHPFTIILLFVALGVVYSVKTPAFETPDEIWHFAFIHHLHQGHGLPVSEPSTQELWRQQGVQAPGYYLAAAALTAWIDTRDFPQIYARANPHVALGDSRAAINRNFLLPYADDGWPWQGTFLALHVARLFSVLLGAVTLWATYQTLRLIVPAQIAFFGTASFAFIPQFIFISAAVSNDNAINALAALVLWRVVALAMKPPDTRSSDTGSFDPDPAHHATSRFFTPQRRDFLILGVLLGIAVLTKLSALGLVGVAGLAVLGYSLERRDWRIVRDAILWIGVPLLLIGGWWYLRNWLLYNDPLAWNVWQANILLRVEPAGWNLIRNSLAGLADSFWGVFGWMNVLYPEIVYRLFRSLVWLVSIGLILGTVRWIRLGHGIDRRFWAGALLAIWIVVLAVSWVRFMQIAPAAQGRYFHPAAPTIALFMGLGVYGWRLWTLPWVMGCVLFTLSALTPWWIIQPAYTPSVGTQLAEGTPLTPVEAQVGDGFRIRGVHAEPAQLTPGETATVTIQWHAVDSPEGRSEAGQAQGDGSVNDYSVFVHLVDDDGLTIAQLDTVPGGGLRPTSQWQPGAQYTEQYAVYIPPSAYTPTQATWAVGLYGVGSVAAAGPIDGGRLPVTLENTAPAEDNVAEQRATEIAGVYSDGSALYFGTVAVTPPAGEVPNALYARFEDGMGLAGYTLSRRVLQPGDTLDVTLYWQPEQTPSRDYTIFVHLLDEALDGAGGEDRTPDTPTTAWTAGEIYVHEHSITIPPERSPGFYRLAVGMYAQPGFDRLSLVDPGQVLGATLQAEGADRYLLGRIRIDAQESNAQ